MTALLDPTRAFPAARRSGPEALRTARVPAFGPDVAAETTLLAPDRATLRRPLAAALLGAAVAIAGAATIVGVGMKAPLAPLPPPAPIASPSACTGGSCEGLDPTTEGCQQDARTVASRVVTAKRQGLEMPVGVVEVRASPACRAVWGRYAIDPTAPVDEVSVQSRDGRTERTMIDAPTGQRHLGYGTTPMLTGSADVRALASPAPGGKLPSAATGWSGGRP